MDEAPKHTLTDVNMLANGGTVKKMDRERSRGPVDRNTLVNSRTTYRMAKVRIRFPVERNT
jgi:hypothetical protein